MSTSSLKCWLEQDGKLLRLRLNRPKANIIDAAMISELTEALAAHEKDPRVRAVLLDAEGPHFSFGASVPEHLPGPAAQMLRQLHALILQLLQYSVPVLVAVRGQCLGGGLEVVAACHLIFVEPGAMLGQPEVKLSVIAPAASCLLQERIGQAQAQDLLFSGRSIDAEEAHRIGLVNSLTENSEQAAIAYFEEFLAPLSGSSLRFAVRAANIARGRSFKDIKTKLDAIEVLYNEELIHTHDAMEGLNSFIEKRPAIWKDC